MLRPVALPIPPMCPEGFSRSVTLQAAFARRIEQCELGISLVAYAAQIGYSVHNLPHYREETYVDTSPGREEPSSQN